MNRPSFLVIEKERIDNVMGLASEKTKTILRDEATRVCPTCHARGYTDDDWGLNRYQCTECKGERYIFDHSRYEQLVLMYVMGWVMGTRHAHASQPSTTTTDTKSEPRDENHSNKSQETVREN